MDKITLMAKHGYFELYTDSKGEWRWTFYGNNHKSIAVASEGYKNKSDCVHAAKLISDSADAEIKERKKD